MKIEQRDLYIFLGQRTVEMKMMMHRINKHDKKIVCKLSNQGQTYQKIKILNLSKKLLSLQMQHEWNASKLSNGFFLALKIFQHDRAMKQQKKAMIRNSAIMHSLANSKALSEGTPSIAGGMAASLASSLPENPKIKVEKPQASLNNHEDYHSEGHSRSLDGKMR